MTYIEFNKFCQSLPATSYVNQWGGSHVWKVGTKVFAIGGWQNLGNPGFSFRVSDHNFEMLSHQNGFRPAPYMASRGLKWIQICDTACISEDELKYYLQESHRIISLGLTKKLQKQLGLNQAYEGDKMLNEIPAKVYRGISFAKGELPDFNLLRSCFLEQGLFINNKGESPLIKSVADYMLMIEGAIKSGIILSITEVELSSNVQVFGKVAQISSEYELVFEGKQGLQTRYGVNLFQFIYKNDQWLISSMCWDDRGDKSLLSVPA